VGSEKYVIRPMRHASTLCKIYRFTLVWRLSSPQRTTAAWEERLGTMTRSRIGMALATAGLLGIGTLAAATPASADYGKTAVYQVELSANISGRLGGGAWLWLELSNDGSVDYQGSDCGHGGVGAAHDGGSTTWSQVGDKLVIPNVVLNGLGAFPATITVPDVLGHYTGTVGTYITLPPFIPAGAGNSQLQVAP
jgi:hypothetical protein